MAGFNLFLKGIPICILLFLIASCAEVMPLSGGEQDENAPKVDLEKSFPQNGAVAVQPSELKLVFDEFITLNDPNNTVSINPSLGKIDVEKTLKSVLVKWEKTPEPNTTYIVSLNGTVRDNNENNDTIIQWVFSTGLTVDSGRFEGIVGDAFEGFALGNVTVGLWNTQKNPLQDAPIYMTRSAKNGEFGFQYLKKGYYQLFAFSDLNKNLVCDANEPRGFLSDSLQIPKQDTLPVALTCFLPKINQTKLKARLEKPGLVVVKGFEASSSLPSVNGTTQVIKAWDADSVRLVLPNLEFESLKITTNKDTLVVPYKWKDRIKNFKINSVSNSNIKQGDTLWFEVNDRIASVDETQMKFTELATYKSGFIDHRYWILPSTTSDFTVRFGEGAILGQETKNDSCSFQFKWFETSELSNLVLTSTTLDEKWIIQLIDPKLSEGKNCVAVGRMENGKLTFSKVVPNNYVIRCIEDVNGNGKWDTGSFEEKLQPETIVRFSLRQKLRPNWDIEQQIER